MSKVSLLRPFASNLPLQLPARCFSVCQDFMPACLRAPRTSSRASAGKPATPPTTLAPRTPGVPSSLLWGRTLTVRSKLRDAGYRHKTMSLSGSRKARAQLGTEVLGPQQRTPMGGMEVEVLPILRYQNGVDQIIVVSRYDRFNEKTVVSLPSGGSVPGEEAWETAWRLTEHMTGLCPSTFSRGLLSTPLSAAPTGRGRLVSVDIDARAAMDSMGSKKRVVFAPPVGQDLLGIPLESLRDKLLAFAKEGRSVDHRLSYLAEGLELRYARNQQTLHSDATGQAIGFLWMAASCAYAMVIICGGLGVGTGLKVEVTRSGQMPSNWADPDSGIQ